jgi:phytanoyl-CoA hydroxylase
VNWFFELLRGKRETQTPAISLDRAVAIDPSEPVDRFGGLWTDRLDAQERLVSLADIDTTERDLLLKWISHGYVVIPNVLQPSDCDRVVQEIGRAIDERSRQMAYWKEGVKHIHASDRERLMEFECKVLDVHATMASVRNAVFAPKLARFLELIFRTKATAFQTLYLERGSEQGVHQDTAFVYVDPPLDFAASWIALEDIKEGSGELEYYPRSHRLPHTLFGVQQTKAFVPVDPIALRYTDYLHEKCRDAGLVLERFLPKKGDALVWAADLVHGGAPRTSATTRRSLVTHYCPVHRKPPYANAGQTPAQHESGHYWLSQT